MKLTVYNDRCQFHIPPDRKWVGFYTPLWRDVMDEARHRGATTVEVLDERTGEVLVEEEAVR